MSPESQNQSPQSVNQKSCALIRKIIGELALLLILLLAVPDASQAEVQQYNVVTDEFYGLNAERILLVPTPEEADQIILMTGKCKSRGPTEIYLEDDPINAREKWYILSEKDDIKADMQICITGNLPAWFEKVALIN